MIVPCYLFDLDGTCSDPNHRLHHIQKAPKDWQAFFAACKDDPVIAHIHNLACDLAIAGQAIIYVSGRSDEVYDLSLGWLRELQFPMGPAPYGDLNRLYMRKAGDHRPDHIVKRELLDRIRADGWAPIMAFDDRDQAVAMWRAAGVPCAQVAPGDF